MLGCSGLEGRCAVSARMVIFCPVDSGGSVVGEGGYQTYQAYWDMTALFGRLVDNRIASVHSRVLCSVFCVVVLWCNGEPARISFPHHFLYVLMA